MSMKSMKSVLCLVVALGIVVAAVTVSGCSGGGGNVSSPSQVYGVWRITESSVDGKSTLDEMTKEGGAMFIEFTETAITTHMIMPGMSMPMSVPVEWSTRDGKLYNKNTKDNTESSMTLSGNTLMIEGKDKSGKKTTMKLTRSSQDELKAAKEKAGAKDMPSFKMPELPKKK